MSAAHVVLFLFVFNLLDHKRIVQSSIADPNPYLRVGDGPQVGSSLHTDPGGPLLPILQNSSVVPS